MFKYYHQKVIRNSSERPFMFSIESICLKDKKKLLLQINPFKLL